jgi:hypothetical protein
MSLQALSDYVVYSKYAHFLPEEKRRETWEEITDRVFSMHEKKYAKELLGNKDFKQMFENARQAVKEKKVLGSQRALQFGSSDQNFGILKSNAKIFNCFSRDTTFLTEKGVKSFTDFQNGDEVKVLTHKGNWKSATVRSYGEQELNEITIIRGQAEYTIHATENHRWILADGQITSLLKTGDTLLPAKNIFNKFDYDNSTPFEKLYWCYGYVYGDGTTIKNKKGETKYSMVRLCKRDQKYENRFVEMGFSCSSPLSCSGDLMCYTGKYHKISPNPEKDSPELIRAFVAGYLAADAEKNRNTNFQDRPYISIQTSELDHIDFVRKCFPIAGIYIVSEEDKTGETTNFGIRDKTIRFIINNNISYKTTGQKFTVKDIQKTNRKEIVWCLEVEQDQSFVLPFGLTTGNCTSTLVDRPRAFQEIGYVLINGCGAGYSVQKHHIDQLPKIQKRNLGKKTYKPIDAIEGWAECWGVLANSFFEGGIYPQYQGYEIEFDLSDIRPAGALIAGQFKAPGPQPLKKSLDKIRHVFEKAIENGQDKLSALNAHDIICHIADSIISGGVRRSALISLFSKEDKEMAECKTGSWFIDNAQRGRANNSVVLERNKISKEEFNQIFENIKQYGEPGFYFVDDGAIHQSTNPCMPLRAKLLTKNGIKELKDILEGDVIWSNDGWTKITKKWKTGTKDVFRYKTTFGSIELTDNHAILSNGNPIEIGQAESIDVLRGPFETNIELDNQSIIDGLVLGDGTYHKASKTIMLLIGLNDKDYFNSEIASLIINQAESVQDCGWRIKTTITPEELPYTYNRRVPSRFLQADYKKVCSFLRGIYSANGSVCGGRVTLKTTSYNLVEDIQLMLSSVGISSYYTTNKPSLVSFANGDYLCKKSYDINISKDALRFYQIIGFIQKYKNENLERAIELKKYTVKNDRSKDIIGIDFVSNEDVYDITVDNESHTFWCNGFNIHNCCEIGFWPKLENGDTGISACNLTEINGAACVTEEEFYKACEHASFLGTLQAGYDSFPYLGKTTEEIIKKEALLGVSITGWMDNPSILFDENILKNGVKVVKDINLKVAKIININPSARLTCTKPSGSASSVLMTGSGIHAQHSKFFLRRVQSNKKEFAGKVMKKKNPIAVNPSVWSTNKTDNVISFPCAAPKEALVKKDLNALNFLEKVKFAYQNWVIPGTNKELGLHEAVTHNISVTVNVAPDEWEQVREYIFVNKNYFSGISLLSTSGDLDYDQAPFVEVLNSKELVEKYGDGVPLASGLIVDGLHSFENLWRACDTLMGFGEKMDEIHDPVEPKKPRKLKGVSEKTYANALANYAIELNLFYQAKGEFETLNLKKEWVRRAKQFAERYFNGDVKQMTYCLKHVSIWKDWLDIQREWKDIDWANIKENEQEYTDADTMSAVACSGGTCEKI